MNQLKKQLTNIVTNLSHTFMESDLSKVIDQTSPQGVTIMIYLKIYHQFQTVFASSSRGSISCQNISRVYT